MSQVADQPRAHIHCKILEAAEARPDASLEELAAEVSGATSSLVDRVLDEYGDPCQPSSDTEPAMKQHDSHPRLEDLTETQQETLVAIRDHPDATQRELADMLGVSSATISQRLSSIDGFEWEDREQFVDTLVGKGSKTPDGGTMAVPERDAVDRLDERISRIEERLEDRSDGPVAAFDDPELVHKVVHACMASDGITEEEELRILREIL